MDQLRQRRRALQRQERDAVPTRRNGGAKAIWYWPLGTVSRQAAARSRLTAKSIRIDPETSVAANADTYFAAYKRKKRAQEEVPGLLRKVENEFAYCEQAEALLEAAESPPDVRALRDELREQGIVGGGRPRKDKGRKGRRGKDVEEGARPVSLWLDEIQVLVGRSGAQNDAALRLADADDVWLHARNVPGAHTVLRSGGRDVPEATIQQAAQIAAYYSKLRDSTSAEVDVTKRRIRTAASPAGSDTPGLVTYRNEARTRSA